MKNTNKLTRLSAAVIAFTLVFASSVVAAASTELFDDVSTSHESYEAITYLQDEDVVRGYDDGTYKPTNSINRAEFVKIAILSMGETPEGGNCFPDVNNEWYAPYICKAKDLGLVQGYPDNYFRPEKTINFVESSKILSEGLGINKDDSLDDLWFHKYVSSLEGETAIPLSVDTLDKYIDRAEMAEMIWRVKTNQTEDSNDYDSLKEQTDDEQVQNVESCTYLEDLFEEDSYYYGYEDDVMFLEAEEAVVDSAVPTTISGATGSVDKSASNDVRTGGGGVEADFSTTNVQVEGVDEADIVKTDGEYIYIVKGQTVRVVKAYPATELDELAEIDLSDDNFTPTDMYVDGDKLVVLGSSYYNYPYPLRDEIAISRFPYYGGSLSKVYIFDISDKTDIQEFRVMEFEGNYSQSRKIDEMVYVVFNRYPFYAYPEILDSEEVIPHYWDSGDDQAEPLVGCGDVKYIPAHPSNNYLIVVGIPIDDDNADISKEVILGDSQNIYSSRDNMYVATTSYNYNEYGSGESTQIYKFELGRDDIDFDGKGRVPGRILNQFSMDEHDGNFRIATTKGNVWAEGAERLVSNVYVLDDNMDMIGKLEGIAPGESIYSTRFLGDRLYMVTFKKIDPFFVIDMGDARNPNILGKLKIPGYSDYLHPYDENHIIAFGKDVAEPTEQEEFDWNQDFAWYQGMQVALFDVTDVENPKQLYKTVIGDRGTESELLHNHKALLFDKAKGLLVFPVTVAELSDEVKNDPYASGSEYGEFVFQGAYVYKLDLNNGFQLQGTITHYDETEVADKSGYYWSGDKDIKRALYIGDYLYTVSLGMVKANELDGLADVAEEEIGGVSNDYFYEY